MSQNSDTGMSLLALLAWMAAGFLASTASTAPLQRSQSALEELTEMTERWPEVFVNKNAEAVANFYSKAQQSTARIRCCLNPPMTR